MPTGTGIQHFALCTLHFALCTSHFALRTLILDTLANSARYVRMHPDFPRAFEFLATTDLSALAPGRHEIDGDRLYVSIDHQDGRGEDGARLEAHRRYIDIQYTIEGRELIGWMPLARVLSPDGGFDETKDVGFFADRPSTWVSVPPGSFTIFFPHDAHAPLAGQGPLKKAIVKIAVGAEL
jgi:biofilm protein TabA